MTINEEFDFLIRKKTALQEKYKYLEQITPQKCCHGIDDAIFSIEKCPQCIYNFFFFCTDNNILITSDKLFQEPVARKLIDTEIMRRYNDKKKQEVILEEERIKEKERHQKEIEKNELIKKYGWEIYEYVYHGYLKPEEIGKRYERFVGYLYEKMGYKVEYHGIKMGKEDGGIDIIATDKSHVVIVQCKRRGQLNQIHVNTVKQLIGTLADYRAEFPEKNVECVLYTQNDNLDDSARKTLSRHPDIVHLVEKYPFDEGKEYPLIKCNIGKDNERIYHLPTDAMYDRIKIEIKKGESYVYTELEAEALGFRRTKN